MRIVIKIGGSVSITDKGPDKNYFKKLLPVLKRLKKHHQMIVVVGGGGLTRSYGRSIENFPLSNREKEEIFIELIKSNVRFLAGMLKMRPIFSLGEIGRSTSGVIGGIAPGRSTDANGALAAKKIRADLFIKLTDVDGVYDKDPNKFKGARKLNKLRFSDMKKLAVKGAPNKYGVLDRLAIQSLSRARIRAIIVNGKNPGNIEKAIRGEKIGTTITSS